MAILNGLLPPLDLQDKHEFDARLLERLCGVCFGTVCESVCESVRECG